ncbi:MAG: hypothetical protein Q9170_001954 [Blastenia crenularia]
MMERGALTKRLHEIPNSIKDAMKITDTLGERYLLVDSLCIIQDNSEDKALQITAMDSIYSYAILTIAAASSTSADTGLPGMSAGHRNFQRHVEKVQGTYLANRPRNFGVEIAESIWNSRAWTLQEKVLSPRVLYLGTQRCFFTCQHRQDEFLESGDPKENGLGRTERSKRLKDQNVNLIPASKSINVYAYGRIVQAYTSRHLTLPSDILNAFQAIAGSEKLDVTRMKTCLELNGSKPTARDTAAQTFATQRAAKANIFNRLHYRTEWRGALENGVPYYMERSNVDQFSFHPTAPENERRLGPHLKPGTDFLVFEAEMEEGTENFRIGGHYKPWAIRKAECTEDSHTVCPLVIRDADGYVAGYVLVPGESATRFSPASMCNLIRISRTKTLEQEGRGEGNPGPLVDEDDVTMAKQSFPDRTDVDKADDSSACDQRRYDTEKPWCLYNVMLVEWIGEVAYRLGVGTVHIDAWAQAKPRKRVITLG